MEGLRSQSSQHKEKTILECRICSPPYVFRHKPTEALFLEYSFHIRRVTVSSLLGIYILLMAVLAILYFAYQRRPTEQNLYHVCLCVLGILLYIFINTEYFSSVKQLNIASYLLWTLLLLFGFISLPLGPWTEKMADKDTVYAAEGVWQLVFIIYCLYLILSVNFFMTVLFGLVLALVHTGVILIRLRDLSSIAENWIEIMVSGILFLAANGVGILAHHVGEKSQRESFINCRAYIGAKLQLQDEGQKLVKVAEMCLPKFLCHEVCADLTMYNSVVCPRQIFAKSYDNVSIAYINITGLEKLKVQIESSEYVSIINDLSVTFEALCEVHNCLALVQLGERFAAVSGIPVSDARGTHSCVSLCVDMIQAVQFVQQATSSPVEALTGVHFGSVATGIVGTYRWQYKSCSNDMLLARHLALTGANSKVHITEACLGQLSSNMYEVEQSNRSHGLTIATYYVRPTLANQKVSPAVVKLNRRLNQVDSVASLMRLESMENDEPFFTQLFRSSDSKPAMTTCLMEGKVFVHRLAHDNMDNDVTNKAFQHAVKVGSVEHETAEQLSFVTLRFHEKLTETSFTKELKGFGLTLVFALILLLALAVLHFSLLPRTMLMLSAVLFLFIFLSMLCIILIASKLQVIRCRCLSHHSNKLALLIIIIVFIAVACLLNLLACPSGVFSSRLPLALRYSILESDIAGMLCPSPYFMFLSGIMVLFIISITRISHIIQTVLIVFVAAPYIVVVAYTHSELFAQHDALHRDQLPPSSVMGMIALLHFALLHMIVGRHTEWVRRLDYIWRHKEMSSYQKAQDMITLRVGVAENALPSHVHSHYNSPEGAMRPYSMHHKYVGVAFVTVPNFSGFINDMQRTGQPLALVQVLHDVTSAFDHLLRRSNFHVVEKVYDDGLNYVLVSGISQSPVSNQRQQDAMLHHLCKLLDLLLDMKHCLLQLNAMSGRNLVLRAGVTMGAVIEGVFGYKRPQYNIWGPALEIAKNLELSGKMNHLQVNKEVAQFLRERFQFQPRAQANMGVFQELQPYIVVSRRLQAVIASDNESVSSESHYGARSPALQNHSMGSISQAETVVVNGQMCRPAPSITGPRIRTASFEMRSSEPVSGMMYISNSGNSTPSGSFTRNQSRDGIFLESWKLPQSPSLPKLTATRCLSPELPAVHYTKNTNGPLSQGPGSDSRGTIILTQANLTGNVTPTGFLGQDEFTSTSEFVQPCTVQTSLPKVANVINSGSMKHKQQLSPVGELAISGERAAKQSNSSLSSALIGRTTPTSQQDRVSNFSGGRVTPGSAGSSHGSQLGKLTSHGFVFSAPQSPPPQARMSPALSYTKSTPSHHRHQSRSSSQSSHKASPVVQRTYDSSGGRLDCQASDPQEYRDTVPLLAEYDQPYLRDKHESPHMYLKDKRESPQPYLKDKHESPQPYLKDKQESSQPYLKDKQESRNKPTILDLNRIMSSSLYSDKMQTSMEGNVSSTSTTPDDTVPMMPLQTYNHVIPNSEPTDAQSNPGLSPLLKRQMNRFAAKQDTPHKSPHLPRKHSVRSNSSGSRTAGANTICSLSPPSTPLESPNVPAQQSTLAMTIDQDAVDSDDQCLVQDSYSWQGARPKLFSNVAEPPPFSNGYKSSPPPLPNPPPPAESITGSEMSELSDDDNENVHHVYDANGTDYDNMYSTDYGTYDNRAALYPHKSTSSPYNKLAYSQSDKFKNKLKQMQCSGQNVRELYSEVESDAADCESLVGDTDCETEPMGTQSISHGYGHPRHKQLTENRLLALLKPSLGVYSTLGSTLRHCRSMELLPSESEATTERNRRKGRSRPRLNNEHPSQHFDDNISVTSSMLGSEYSKSDPYLSDIGAYESEYDNYRPDVRTDDNFFSSKPIVGIDLNQFGNVDFDKIKMSENMTTQDYILNLQQHIESRQKSHITDV